MLNDDGTLPIFWHFTWNIETDTLVACNTLSKYIKFFSEFNLMQTPKWGASSLTHIHNFVYCVFYYIFIIILYYIYILLLLFFTIVTFTCLCMYLFFCICHQDKSLVCVNIQRKLFLLGIHEAQAAVTKTKVMTYFYDDKNCISLHFHWWTQTVGLYVSTETLQRVIARHELFALMTHNETSYIWSYGLDNQTKATLFLHSLIIWFQQLKPRWHQGTCRCFIAIHFEGFSK